MHTTLYWVHNVAIPYQPESPVASKVELRFVVTEWEWTGSMVVWGSRKWGGLRGLGGPSTLLSPSLTRTPGLASIVSTCERETRQLSDHPYTSKPVHRITLWMYRCMYMYMYMELKILNSYPEWTSTWYILVTTYIHVHVEYNYDNVECSKDRTNQWWKCQDIRKPVSALSCFSAPFHCSVSWHFLLSPPCKSHTLHCHWFHTLFLHTLPLPLSPGFAGMYQWQWWWVMVGEWGRVFTAMRWSRIRHMNSGSHPAMWMQMELEIQRPNIESKGVADHVWEYIYMYMYKVCTHV